MAGTGPHHLVVPCDFSNPQDDTRRRDPLTMTLRLMRLRNSTACHIFHEIFHERNRFTSFSHSFSPCLPVFSQRYEQKTTDTTLISLVTNPVFKVLIIISCLIRSKALFLMILPMEFLERNFFQTSRLSVPTSRLQATGALGRLAARSRKYSHQTIWLTKTPISISVIAAAIAPQATLCDPGRPAKQLHSKPMEVNERFSGPFSFSKQMELPVEEILNSQDVTQSDGKKHAKNRTFNEILLLLLSLFCCYGST